MPNSLGTASSAYKRQNIYSLKKSFSQQKFNEILDKNENEENKLAFFDTDTTSSLSHTFETKDFLSSKKRVLRNNSFRAAIGELQITPEAVINKKCSLMRSATNEFHSSSVNEFNFKIPKSVMSNQHFTKSASMNFSTLEMASSYSEAAKKRKASLSSSSSNSLSSKTSLLLREHKSRKVVNDADDAKHVHKNIDFTREYGSTRKLLGNYTSLRNLSSFDTNSMTRSNLSLNELSSFIKYNMPKSMEKEEINTSKKSSGRVGLKNKIFILLNIEKHCKLLS